MGGREEQKEEREVLDSIFPDEITDVSETEYRVAIKLDVPVHEDEEDDAPTIILKVTYPEDYPDVAPHLDISAPPNAPKYDNLDVSEDKERLLEALQETIDENIGMAMIFTIVSTLKDSAELLISERQQAQQALVDIEVRKAEEEENKKFVGTPVNRETFLKWNEEFKKDMEEEEKRRQEEKEIDDKMKRIPKKEKKMTGKELWEKGLAGKGDEEDEDGEDAVEALQKMEVKA